MKNETLSSDFYVFSLHYIKEELHIIIILGCILPIPTHRIDKNIESSQIPFLFQVSWLKRHGEKLDLLTWGPQVYSKDERYEIAHVSPTNWQLKIKYVNERDQGHYECQISSHPPLVKHVYLTVVGKLHP